MESRRVFFVAHIKIHWGWNETKHWTNKQNNILHISLSSCIISMTCMWYHVIKQAAQYVSFLKLSGCLAIASAQGFFPLPSPLVHRWSRRHGGYCDESTQPSPAVGSNSWSSSFEHEQGKPVYKWFQNKTHHGENHVKTTFIYFLSRLVPW